MIDDYCNILNVYISAVNMQETVDYLTDHLEELRGQYICVANVHTTVTAYQDDEYRHIQNSSALTLPDGNPLATACRKCGFIDTERVTGPDLMSELFKISESKGYRHYFYGASQDTLDTLKANLLEHYPQLMIAGMYAPPYRPLTADEEREDVRQINDVHPDYIWIGLGAPKQEQWMYRNRNNVNGLMIGVGAGFEFHAGLIKRAPQWMQKLSLEWLFRLIQNPKRLWKRYLQTNIFYILKKMSGGAYHPINSRCNLEEKKRNADQYSDLSISV